MSVHQKTNGVWFVQYRVSGEKGIRREYCGTGDAGKQRARIRDAEIKHLKAQGRQVAFPRDRVYLDNIAQAYLLERKTGGASAKWLEEMRTLLNEHILPALTIKPAEAVTYTDIVALVAEKWGGCKLSTRQRYTGYLKALFQFGVDNSMIPSNPLAKWKKKAEPKKTLRLTVEGLKKILKHAAPHVVWAIEVEWEIGARPGPSELFALEWQDVDFKRHTLHIRGTKTDGANRVIPITPDFCQRLKERRQQAKSAFVVEYRGQPVVKVDKALKAAARRAGVGYSVCMYDIRHLFASTMLAGGADLAAVSRLLGHKSISTTQKHYYHLLAGEMGRAIRTRPGLGVVPANAKGARQRTDK